VHYLTSPARAARRKSGNPDVVNDGLRVSAMETYAYSTTKAGVHMLTRHLAGKLAAESMTVNAIAPGPFDSKMMAFALDDPQTRAAICGQGAARPDRRA
jgi:NAD(P)-dependent dehydrogenase (short-subunit alcohol dehydrogenase family)